MKHQLSVEIDTAKRDFIMNAHKGPDGRCEFHCWSDVSVFEKSEGWCYTCKKNHSASVPLDVLFCGCSCKNLSKEFTGNRDFQKCCLNHVTRLVCIYKYIFIYMNRMPCKTHTHIISALSWQSVYLSILFGDYV